MKQGYITFDFSKDSPGISIYKGSTKPFQSVNVFKFDFVINKVLSIPFDVWLIRSALPHGSKHST